MLITPILKEEIRVQNQSFPLIFALLLILSVGERLLCGNIKQKKNRVEIPDDCDTVFTKGSELSGHLAQILVIVTVEPM